MANTKSSGENFEYVTVDTAPAVGGIFTEPVSMRYKNLSYIFFSLRGSGTATVTLQFRCTGDADWTDYSNDGNAFANGDRKLIEGNAGGVQWRAGVKEGDYTSGSVSFGFDW